MGIVNVTPDSFSDGGLYDTKEAAIVHAAELATAGAASSMSAASRRGRAPTRWARRRSSTACVPVIDGLAGLPAVISIDTRKAVVARAAAKQGAKILNDVSALTYDPNSLGKRPRPV